MERMDRGGRGIASGMRLALLGGVAALALVLALAACDSSAATSADSDILVTRIPWCDQPSLSFQDDSTTAQKIITDWADVKDQLGFTPYLPPSLPAGTCLALAGGSIHNPIYGGQLSITYVLPGVGPLSFSQAPKRPNLPTKTQCVQSQQDSTTTICAGVVGSTSITIASRQSAKDLTALFGKLQPTQNWVPQTTATPASGTTTPATTGTTTPAKGTATATTAK